MAEDSGQQHSLDAAQRGDILILLDERMRRIAEETFAALGRPRQESGCDVAAAELGAKLACIRAKEFVSVAEAALLLGCSDGHVRNLVRRAKKGEPHAPVLYRDLDGAVVFKLDELLSWSELPKSKFRAVR
jgi:hypothetical protein